MKPIFQHSLMFFINLSPRFFYATDMHPSRATYVDSERCPETDVGIIFDEK